MACLDPSTIVCRHLVDGKCRRSDCYYSHDTTKSQPGNICRYFSLGICFYGDECRFQHIPPETVERDVDYIQPAPPSVIVITKPVVEPSAVPKAPGPRTRSQTALAAKVAAASKPTVEHTSKRSRRAAKRLNVESNGSAPAAVPSTSTIVTKPKHLPPLCPIGSVRNCDLIDCPFRHGDYCDTCQCLALDPQDAEQRVSHQQACDKKFEERMESTFAVQRSLEKQCEVCLDNVMTQVDVTKRRFGIMEGCRHCFCFTCIMLWRKQQAEGAEDIKRNRSCPTCRSHTNFVFPSKVWPETPADKELVMAAFKKDVAKKHCHKYDQGKGKCPFGSKCWYLHAKADGTVVQLPAPTARRNRTADMVDLFDGMSEDSDVDSYYEMDEEDQLVADLMLFPNMDHANYQGIFGLVGPGDAEELG